ncbi:lysine transporter LysE [Photobacterium proteolyticum]|uniref:Lysine transporter LysE n=1 Tax=Photobacterium proteolyticum TaxID=1903952 RepID=A0A1Q9GUG6_9GAMM|nr:LysE family translocator [Photobacterium proteolyticum]OLQ78800.1 lysine transporter LysE [Photobacterium proteolyticum]
MWEWQFILSLAAFAATMTGTPGPNNLMVTASGANFGYWRTLPHMMGIGLGLVSMIALVAAGLGVVFTRFPLLHELLRWCGSAYLLYLAWKIATAGSAVRTEQPDSRPMTFWAAAMFQYVNPKAWMMSVTAISTFTVAGELYWQSATLVAGVFFLVCFPSVSVWAGFGSMIGRWLHSSRARRVFNGVMGALTAGCVVMIW